MKFTIGYHEPSDIKRLHKERLYRLHNLQNIHTLYAKYPANRGTIQSMPLWSSFVLFLNYILTFFESREGCRTVIKHIGTVFNARVLFLETRLRTLSGD